MTSMSNFAALDFVVVPDDDARVKDLEPNCVACDGRRVYVPDSFWPALQAELKKLPESTTA